MLVITPYPLLLPYIIERVKYPASKTIDPEDRKSVILLYIIEIVKYNNMEFYLVLKYIPRWFHSKKWVLLGQMAEGSLKMPIYSLEDYDL